MIQHLYGYRSEDTAYLVNDYPYGFRLRTQIRYWIETTKHGDRFCSQTLNPKTGRWNAPKKSTYCEVMVMGLNEESHVNYTAFSHWEDEEKLNEWLATKDESQFNDLQTKQIKKLRAIFRTRKHITFEISKDGSKQTEEEKKEVKENINKLFAYEYSKV